MARCPSHRRSSASASATAEQPEEPPQPAVRWREELAQHDWCRRALRKPRRLARLARLVDPADRLVLGVLRVVVEPRSAVDRGEVVERRNPARIFGERPCSGLLEPAEGLVERRSEGSVDRHDLAGRLHLRTERAVGGRELVEWEARQLHHDVVERRLERGHGRAGHDVRNLGQPPADGDLRRDPGDRVARRLRCQRRRPRHAGVHLDHRVLGRVG